MQALNTAVARKVTVSYEEDPGKRGIAFGDTKGRSVAPIDSLAAADSGKHSAELAYLMATISSWAYSDEQVLAAKLKYYGMPGARIRRVTVQNNALLVVTTGYLIQSHSGKVGVLAFRGTDPGDFITVLTDTQVMQRPFAGGNVHTGFYTSVEVVWDEIHDALTAALNGSFLDGEGREEPMPNRLETLYITGHSLGGAMAVLAAARLFAAGYEKWEPRTLIKGVYTFGQPMVGDHGFARTCAERFGSKLYRHVFNDDVVPHLPPKSGFDYAHTGEDWRSSRPGEVWAPARASGRATLALASIMALLNFVETRTTPRDLLRGYSIDDHMPPSYLETARLAFDPAGAPVPRAALPPIAEIAEIAESAARRVSSAVTSVIGALGKAVSP